MQCPDIAIELWTDTASPSPTLDKLIARNSLPLRRQQGADLGLRMHHAINHALCRSNRVVLIGTDCPDWHPHDLAEAFELLNNHDAVVAPALDGGYVLVGCRRNTVALFSDIPWGTNQVFAITKNRLQSLGWRWHELPAHPDIDCEPDLVLVPELLG